MGLFKLFRAIEVTTLCKANLSPEGLGWLKGLPLLLGLMVVFSKWWPIFENFAQVKMASIFSQFSGWKCSKYLSCHHPVSCLGSCCSDCSFDCLCTVSLLVVVVVVLEHYQPPGGWMGSST